MVKVMHSGHSLSNELPNFYLAKVSSVTNVIHEITSCRKLCHQVIPECNSTNTLNQSQCASSIFFAVDQNTLPWPQSFWTAPRIKNSGRNQKVSQGGSITAVSRDRGAGGAGGASAPPIILENFFFQLKNYCFTAFIDMR